MYPDSPHLGSTQPPGREISSIQQPHPASATDVGGEVGVLNKNGPAGTQPRADRTSSDKGS
jgi:hypothetical protein